MEVKTITNKKIRRINKFIQYRLIESNQNGKKPIMVSNIQAETGVARKYIILAGSRAIRKLQDPETENNFPVRRLFDSLPTKRFKPIIGWEPVTQENIIETEEEKDIIRRQAKGLGNQYNNFVKVAKQNKFITGRIQRQLLLSL